MATDGDIDFRTYTREQLDSAVGRMDRDRYPINHRNLTAEYQRRRIALSQASELAAESGSVVAPDPMLSVARTFAVTFEPGAGPSRWLGPSRNDLHLVGAGTVQVDGEIVRVRGCRFSIWFGLPFMRTDELGRRFVANVECDGAAIRFELRVPGERCCGVTLWLRSAEDARELAQALPTGRTVDVVPQLLVHVEFERRLIAQSPTPRVTYALIFLNVFAYLTTAVVSNHLLGFDGPSLVPLGSNFGPYTTDGEGWRLLTAMFLHLGLLHLAFNMWALISFGPIVERLYGSIAYGCIYLFAGVLGGLASVTWLPDVNSVGASGAIFGIFGALIAAQLRNWGSIPKSVLPPLRTTSLIYIGCALAAGLLRTGVDNAAHIGGMAAGFILGVAVSRPVTGRNLATRDVIRRCLAAVPLGALLLGAGVWSAQHASSRLMGEGLFSRTMHWFVPREAAAVGRWQELRSKSQSRKWDDNTYAGALDTEIVPFWREAVARLDVIDLEATSPSYGNLQFVRNIADGRLRAFEHTVRGLRLHDAEMVARAMRDMQRVDELIAAKIGSDKQQR